MAKKKAAQKKKKSTAAKTNRGKSLKKKVSTKAPDRLPALAKMKATGATAIEVHFDGYGDDGCFHFRAKAGSKDLQVPEAARVEIEQFLTRHFNPSGVAFGSILLAHFDLLKSECVTLSGEGGPRTSELIAVLDSYGVDNLVGVVQGGTFKQCRVTPGSAMSREAACSYVNRFLQIALDDAQEYDSYGEELNFYDEELKKWKGQWRIDVKSGNITVRQSSKQHTVKAGGGLTGKKLQLLQ